MAILSRRFPRMVMGRLRLLHGISYSRPAIEGIPQNPGTNYVGHHIGAHVSVSRKYHLWYCSG